MRVTRILATNGRANGYSGIGVEHSFSPVGGVKQGVPLANVLMVSLLTKKNTISDQKTTNANDDSRVLTGTRRVVESNDRYSSKTCVTLDRESFIHDSGS